MNSRVNWPDQRHKAVLQITPACRVGFFHLTSGLSLNDVPILTTELVTLSSISKHQHPLSIAEPSRGPYFLTLTPSSHSSGLIVGVPSIRDALAKNSSSCSTVHQHFCAVSGKRIRIATYTHRMRNRRRVSRCASPTSSHAPCCANQKTSSASAPKPSSVVLRVIVLQRGCQHEDI